MGWGAGWFPETGEKRGRPGVGQEGWPGRFSHPFSGVEYSGHAPYPAFLLTLSFALSSSEVAGRLFGLFISYCPYFAPTAHACSYF